MTYRTLALRSELHPITCDCDRCRPLAAARPRERTANDFALLTISGLVTGLFLAKLLDLVIAGPGISQMFGW